MSKVSAILNSSLSNQIVILPLCTTMVINVNAQSSEWSWQHPHPYSNQHTGIEIISDSVVVAVSVGGMIARSTNAGEDWVASNLGTRNSFQDVTFVDENQGWLCGQGGIIFNTEDGGANWEMQRQGGSWLYGIHFVDESVGYTAGVSGSVLKTIDGGENWEELSTGTSVILNCVYFADAMTGWIGGFQSTLRKTTDGGETWFDSNIDIEGIVEAIQFVDALNGWAVVGSGKLYSTVDGGATWKLTEMGAGLQDVHFINRDTGWVCGGPAVLPDAGRVWSTADGGESWEADSVSSWLTTVHTVDGVTIASAGTAGGIFMKDDDRDSFEITTDAVPTSSFADVEFVDTLHGWACGNFGDIVRTTNGGQTWDRYETSSNLDLNDVHMVDENNGWVVGSSGTVLHTQDGGDSWAPVDIGATVRLYAVFFTDAMNGWIAGRNGSMWHTTDGGANWTEQNTGETKTITCLYFRDEQTGWAGGFSRMLLMTTDGGETWEGVDHESRLDITDIIFRDSLQGFASGSDGWVIETIDGGLTWKYTTSTASPVTGLGLTDIALSANESIWTTEDGGRVFVSYDDGATWQAQFLPFRDILGGISFGAPDQAWVAGTDGAIFKGVIDTTVSFINFFPSRSESNELFSTPTVYPNPASDILNANVTFNTASKGMIRLYDAEGRLHVTTWRSFTQGENIFELDVSNLTSGVYFMELAAGKFIASRQIIVYN